MMIDPQFRDAVVQKTKTRRYADFWHNEFIHLRKNSVDPVLNRISVFLLRETVRNIICQRHSSLNFDSLLNDGKILLANLSTGLLTEQIAGTLGSFLTTKIVNAAFRRAALPEHQRRPFYLYVDEFQSFMNLSVGFDRILAEARKYKLVLAGLANQYVGQLSADVRAAIFGNVGTLVTFRLGLDDAGVLEKEMGVFTSNEILNLGLGEALARAEKSASAFNLKTYPPPERNHYDPTSVIVANTRSRYAQPRAQVEQEFQNHQAQHQQQTDATSLPHHPPGTQLPNPEKQTRIKNRNRTQNGNGNLLSNHPI